MSVQTGGSQQALESEQYHYHNRGLYVGNSGSGWPGGPNWIELGEELQIEPDNGMVMEIYAIDYEVGVRHGDASQDNPSDGVFFYWELSTDSRPPDDVSFDQGSGPVPTTRQDISENATKTTEENERLISGRQDAKATMNDTAESLATTGTDAADRLRWKGRWTAPPYKDGSVRPFVVDFRTELNYNIGWAASMAGVDDDVMFNNALFNVWFTTRQAQV